MIRSEAKKCLFKHWVTSILLGLLFSMIIMKASTSVDVYVTHDDLEFDILYVPAWGKIVHTEAGQIYNFSSRGDMLDWVAEQSAQQVRRHLEEEGKLTYNR